MHQNRINLITYLLYKLAQLCLIIVLIWPILVIVSNTSTSESNGQSKANIKQITYNKSIFNLNIGNNATDIKLYPHAPYPQTDQPSLLQSETKIITNTIRNRYGKTIPDSDSSTSKYSLIILSYRANRFNYNLMNATRFRKSKDRSMLRKTIRAKRDTIHSLGYNQSFKSNTITPLLVLEAIGKGHNYKKRYYDIIDKKKLTKLVMAGLGLKKLPDMRKANISQVEYTSKYLEYLQRQNNHGQKLDDILHNYPKTHIFSIVTNGYSDITEKRWRNKRAVQPPITKKAKSIDSNSITKIKKIRRNQYKGLRDKTNILLHFPLSLDNANFQSHKIDEANVRLMIIYSSSLASQTKRSGGMKKKHNISDHTLAKQKSCGESHKDLVSSNHQKKKIKASSYIVNLKVYQMLPSNKRILLDKRQLEFKNPSSYGDHNDETQSQWLEFDVSSAVRAWLSKTHENLGIEIQCDKCKRYGARILSDPSSSIDGREDDRFHLMPVLNIIGQLGHTQLENGVQQLTLAQNHTYLPNYFHHRPEGGGHSIFNGNTCQKMHQRCCRHQLYVVFKEIKGFEFIIQPKMFDAGFCQGRCPPRHNPAHHHALLQSLIWQQDHNRVPRPCCAPSKLTEIEILHVDEEHSDKLKISTWSDMQVIECACS